MRAQNQGGGLMSILRNLRKQKKQQLRLLVLGLDNAGKTTILKSLCKQDLTSTTPTIGFNIKTLTTQKVRLNIWDIGGQKALRQYWSNYFPHTDALIYVIDSADIKRVRQAGRQLDDLLLQKDISGVPLLIFANKQDLAQALQPDKIMEGLKIGQIKTRKWTITACSAKSGDGLQQGFNWLLNILKK